MNEVEVKILEIDAEKVRKKLEELGAKKVYEGKVDSIIHDFDDERLKSEGLMLRLRSFGKKDY
ncbi:hypothetical protein D6745_01290 [Candidatus Woesearchaeota archaeon]|nr:MAG: hypothetical protein D6745_01290 [Candidatus Woesearchaeota archaeon]